MSEAPAVSDTTTRTRRLVGRAVREFALVPSAVVAAFLALAVIAILADQTHIAAFAPLHALFGSVIGARAPTARARNIVEVAIVAVHAFEARRPLMLAFVAMRRHHQSIGATIGEHD